LIIVLFINVDNTAVEFILLIWYSQNVIFSTDLEVNR